MGINPESAYESYLKQHPYLIDPSLARAALLSQQEVLKRGRYRLDLSLVVGKKVIIVELKATKLVLADLQQLVTYMELKSQRKKRPLGVLIGERSNRGDAGELAAADTGGHTIAIRYWDEHVPRPAQAVICESCEVVHRVSDPACPKCGSGQWRALVKR